MKTLICFENEERPLGYNALTLQKIRQFYPEDLLVMISAGDFTSRGFAMEPSCRKRAEKFAASGADLVLSLPVASILGGNGKKEFAGAALVQRLRAADLLLIPCAPLSGQTRADCERTLRSIAMLMFGEDPEYKRRLKQNLNDKMSLRDAQLQAVCCLRPDAKALLQSPENRHALWLLDSMLQLYYMAKVEFIDAPRTDAVAPAPSTLADSGASAPSASAVSGVPTTPAPADSGAPILSEIAALLDTASPEALMDISGSTSQIVSALLDNKDRIRTAGSPEEIVAMIPSEPADRVRLFLLKALCGIRKIYMQICGLHEFVPYCYVLAGNRDKQVLLDRLEEGSWIPFIATAEQEQAMAEKYRYLLQADRKAEKMTKEYI